MGYTHYFTNKKRITDANKKKITSSVKKIEEHFKSNGLELFDGCGNKPGVEYAEDYIAFNGDPSKGECHETMGIDLVTTDFNFCKTARKPYDIAVTVTLVMLKQVLGNNIDIKSDGDIDDFVDGIEIYNNLFPDKPMCCKFDDGELIVDKEQTALATVIEKI